MRTNNSYARGRCYISMLNNRWSMFYLASYKCFECQISIRLFHWFGDKYNADQKGLIPDLPCQMSLVLHSADDQCYPNSVPYSGTFQSHTIARLQVLFQRPWGSCCVWNKQAHYWVTHTREIFSKWLWTIYIEFIDNISAMLRWWEVLMTSKAL